MTSLDCGENEISVLCTNAKTGGLAYREIAAGLLQRRDWKFVELEVMVVAEAAQAPVRIGQWLYDALAERITTKLASYRDDKTAVVIMPRSNTAVHVQGTSSSISAVWTTYSKFTQLAIDHTRQQLVEARDKSSSSARHAYKRESRRQDMPEEHSDQTSGFSA